MNWLVVVEGHADVNQIGRCARVEEEAAGLLHQNHLFRLRSRLIDAVFGEAWLNSRYARRYWRQTCSSSSGLNTINSRQLRAMEIIVPPESEQRKIASILSEWKDRLREENRVLHKLKILREGLMGDLLTGRVRLPNEVDS
jgi:type I restriction enzyme S subunit